MPFTLHHPVRKRRRPILQLSQSTTDITQRLCRLTCRTNKKLSPVKLDDKVHPHLMEHEAHKIGPHVPQAAGSAK